MFFALFEFVLDNCRENFANNFIGDLLSFLVIHAVLLFMTGLIYRL